MKPHIHPTLHPFSADLCTAGLRETDTFARYGLTKGRKYFAAFTRQGVVQSSAIIMAAEEAARFADHYESITGPADAVLSFIETA